jgi:uncharacterized membrane protein YvlD (DUF360 family)
MARSSVLRVVVVWLLTAGTLLVLGDLLPGLDVEDGRVALVAAAAIGLLNAFVWPVMIRVALPFTVLTLGLGAVALNGALILAVAALDPGLHVRDLGTGIVVAVGITIVNTAVTSLLAIDDDGFWYRNVVKRQARRVAGIPETDVPGLFFLEIDGLAYDVLKRAIRDGNAPQMSRWLRDGSHRLTRWETDWSSQTGACQAGLLHGSNDDMPAFRWWEKDRGQAMVTNHPKDAMEIERRHSDGRGLLFSDGASRANIVSGDAPHSLLTMSTVMRRDRPGRIGQDYYAYFANPYNATRTLALVIREYVAERWAAAQQRRHDVQPRIHRGRVYALMRAWGTIIQRDLQVEAIIADLYAGRPVAYTTFLAYDEVAHHSGIERHDALSTLRHVDRQIGRIAAAAELAPRPYQLVVLSDHGQSQGATFLQRYELTLEQLVRRAAGVEHTASDAGEPGDEAIGFLGASLTEASQSDSKMSGVVRRASRGRSVDGEVRMGEDAVEARDPSPDELPEIVVMASGCLGTVSFPREPGRLTLERIDELYPRLIPALTKHPGIGFALIRSKDRGAVAIGPHGVNYLDERRVEGTDPLEPYGPTAARHVLRTDGFAHCPDIVLNSTYWEDTDEVAAFEELVGSHGGMGGAQSFPFVLHPAELRMPPDRVGPEAVHQDLRRWLVQLGHPEYGLGASQRTEPREPARPA